MNMLDQLRQKQKIRDQKLAKEQVKPKETKSERPLSRVFGFLQNRQEVRLGILYSLRSQSQIVEEPVIEEPKKVEVSYIG